MGWYHWVNQDIIPRLVDRFKIVTHPTVQDPMLVGKTIQPVSDADELLKTPDLKTGAITSAVGNVDLVEVPLGKRWTIIAVDMSRVGGDRTVTKLRIAKSAGGSSVTLATQTAASSLESLPLSQKVVADEGWFLAAFFTGGSADGNWNYKILVLEEDAF